MVGPHAHPAGVRGEVVDAVRDGLTEVGIDEVVDVDLGGITGGLPLPATVAVVADEFFLLGVHTDHRAALVLVGLDLVVEVAELRVAVGMLAPLGGLDVGLQAVPQRLEQPAHHELADLMTALAQRRGQRPGGLAGPPQRRHRIPAAVRVDQLFQRCHQRRVMGLGAFATATGLPRGAHRRRRRIVELGATPPNGVCSHSDRRRDHPRPTWAEFTSLRAQPQPSLTLVQMRPQSLEPTRQ